MEFKYSKIPPGLHPGVLKLVMQKTNKCRLEYYEQDPKLVIV